MSAQLESMVREFTSQLKGTVRAHVMDEVQRTVAQMMRQGRAKRAKAIPTVKVRAGGKRTPKQIEAQATKLFDYIKANPCQRAEQIASGLRMETGDMSLPIKKLLAAGRIKAQGKARGTTYTASRK